MNIATEKKELIKQFNEVNDIAFIQAIKNFLKTLEPTKINNQSAPKHPVSYSPEVIDINNRKYILNYPLRCLFEKEDDHFVIKNETLDIYAVGKTVEETETDFDEEFDNLYKTLNLLNDSQLTPRMTNIKQFINLYVKQVI